MFTPGQPADALDQEVARRLAQGTDPEVVVDHLVRDLDMPRHKAEHLVTAGRYLLQDDPGTPAEPPEGEAAGGLLDRAASAGLTEEELEALDSFSVRLPPGDGRCSDVACPCPAPGTAIPRGSGFLYVSPECVAFRRDARSRRRLEAKGADAQRRGRSPGGHGGYKAVLMCEQGARTRSLDLEVAAADARLAWSAGRAPLRATPTVGAVPESARPAAPTSDEESWFRNDAERGRPYGPADFNLFEQAERSLEEWVERVSHDPRAVHVTVREIRSLGPVVKTLFQTLQRDHDVDSRVATSLFEAYLGAACPKCLGGLRGDLVQLAATAGDTMGFAGGGAAFQRVVGGRCASCDSDTYYIVWHGDRTARPAAPPTAVAPAEVPAPQPEPAAPEPTPPAPAPEPAQRAVPSPEAAPQPTEVARKRADAWFQTLLIGTGIFASLLVAFQLMALSREEMADQSLASIPISLCGAGALWAFVSARLLRAPRSFLRAGSVFVVGVTLLGAWALWGWWVDAPGFWEIAWTDLSGVFPITMAFALVLWQAVWPVTFVLAPLGHLLSPRGR